MSTNNDLEQNPHSSPDLRANINNQKSLHQSDPNVSARITNNSGFGEHQEMTDLEHQNQQDLSDDWEEVIQPPKPPDGGWFAWLVVASGFVCNMIVDGVCYSIGVQLDYIDDTFRKEHERASDHLASMATLTTLGSLMLGCYLIMAPLTVLMCKHWGCRAVTMVGSLLATLALVLSAAVGVFGNDAPHELRILLGTHGVIGGVGMGLVYLSSAVAIGNYFEKRRILAHGIAVCGSGAGIVLGPLLVDWLLREFDWPSTQLILAAIALHSLPAGALYRPLESRVVLVRREQPPDDALAAAVAETASLDNEPDRERYILGEGEVLGEQEVLDEVKKRASRIAKKQRQRGRYRGGGGGGMQLYIPNSEVFKKIWADRHKQIYESQGSLDNCVITSQNNLIRPSDTASLCYPAFGSMAVRRTGSVLGDRHALAPSAHLLAAAAATQEAEPSPPADAPDELSTVRKQAASESSSGDERAAQSSPRQQLEPSSSVARLKLAAAQSADCSPAGPSPTASSVAIARRANEPAPIPNQKQKQKRFVVPSTRPFGSLRVPSTSTTVPPVSVTVTAEQPMGSRSAVGSPFRRVETAPGPSGLTQVTRLAESRAPVTIASPQRAAGGVGCSMGALGPSISYAQLPGGEYQLQVTAAAFERARQALIQQRKRQLSSPLYRSDVLSVHSARVHRASDASALRAFAPVERTNDEPDDGTSSSSESSSSEEEVVEDEPARAADPDAVADAQQCQIIPPANADALAGPSGYAASAAHLSSRAVGSSQTQTATRGAREPTLTCASQADAPETAAARSVSAMNLCNSMNGTPVLAPQARAEAAVAAASVSRREPFPMPDRERLRRIPTWSGAPADGGRAGAPAQLPPRFVAITLSTSTLCQIIKQERAHAPRWLQRRAASRELPTASADLAELVEPEETVDELSRTSCREFLSDLFYRLYSALRSFVLNCRELMDYRLLHRSPVICLTASSGFTMLGFFVPFVLMVTVATQVAGVPRAQAPNMLAVAGLANAITRIAFVWLMQRRPRPARAGGGQQHQGGGGERERRAKGESGSCLSCLCSRNGPNAFCINTLALFVATLALFATTVPDVQMSALLLGLCFTVYAAAIAVYVSLRNLLVLELVREKRFLGALGLLCVVEGFASIIGGFVAGNIIDGSGPISLHQAPGQRPPLQYYLAAVLPYSSRSLTSSARALDRLPPPSPFNGALVFAATMLAVGTVLSLVLMCLARSDRKKRESRRRRAKNKRARRHAADAGQRREREAAATADGNPFPSDAELANENAARRRARPRGPRDARRGSPEAHESDASSPSRSSGGRAPSPPHLSDHELGPVTLRPPSHEGSPSHLSRDSLPHGAREAPPPPSAPATSAGCSTSTRAIVHGDGAAEAPAASGERLPGAQNNAAGMRTSASGSSSSGIGVGCGCCEHADAQAAGQSPSAPLAPSLKPSVGDESSPLLVASTTQ